jgi:hypothetical protein
VIAGRVLSRSCTTSWSDWNHGELVLTDHALIRHRLEEPTEAARKLASTASVTEPPRFVPDPADADQVLRRDATNKYILISDIAEARLHRGILSDRLAITTIRGAKHKLLWLRADPAHAILADQLPMLLGRRFRQD